MVLVLLGVGEEPPLVAVVVEVLEAKVVDASFSVLEGAGRTLKGRDLSKVRNVVLPKIGFLKTL